MNYNEVIESLEIKASNYKVENEEIINKLKPIINITGSSLQNNQAMIEFRLLLTINFSFFFLLNDYEAVFVIK